MHAASPSPPLSLLLDTTAEVVQAVRSGRSLTDVLGKVPAVARPGTQALANTVLRRLGAALAARRLLAPRNPPPFVDGLLITSLALLWPGEPPTYADHTLVDQAVTAARKRAPDAAAFVNAVLRRFLRERASVAAQVGREVEGAWNHPVWWVQRLQADWPEVWTALLGQAQQHPPMALRVNARRSSVADYMARLGEAGLPAQGVPGTGGENALLLAEPCGVDRLPGFADGLVSVQDLSAQRAAGLLLGTGLAPGARVLDACAAPGGKTAHLLEWADLEVLALDVDATRLARLTTGLQRLGLRASTQVGDASRPAGWWNGEPFDAILLDAPCSASGVVRRHPDIRWLRRAEDIAALARLQAAMLDALWPLLKPGGRLLYATCSLFKAEGTHQIDAFLQRQGLPRSVIAPESPGHLLSLPDNTGDGSAMAGADGFFYALLVRPL